MQCQNCKKNEADKAFIFNWMGIHYQMHVCNECLEQMWRYAGAVGQGDMFKSITGWWPGKPEPRNQGENPFPENANISMKIRRRLAELRARLAEAAEQENYEEAARLRDSIAKMEKEDYYYES